MGGSWRSVYVCGGRCWQVISSQFGKGYVVYVAWEVAWGQESVLEYEGGWKRARASQFVFDSRIMPPSQLTLPHN